MMYLNNGYVILSELQELNKYPPEERFKVGPIAVIECIQEIPCNPCENACKFGAIYIGEPITRLPTLDVDKCVGCGICVAHCPGLAIFIIDKSYSDRNAKISFAYEYLPLPENGQIAEAVDRSGSYVCRCKVIRVIQNKVSDKTPVLTIEVPIEFANEVRSIKRL